MQLDDIKFEAKLFLKKLTNFYMHTNKIDDVLIQIITETMNIMSDLVDDPSNLDENSTGNDPSFDIDDSAFRLQRSIICVLCCVSSSIKKNQLDLFIN